MARQTPNQKQWMVTTEELKKRINKLQRKGVDTSEIKLPSQPTRYTQKALGNLRKVANKIEEAENNYRKNKPIKFNGTVSTSSQQKKSRSGHSREMKLKMSKNSTSNTPSSNVVSNNGSNVTEPSLFTMTERYINARIEDAIQKGSKTAPYLRQALEELYTVHGKENILAKFQQGISEGAIKLDAILFGSDSVVLFNALTDCITYLIDDDEDLSDYLDLENLSTELWYGAEGVYKL